MLYDIHQQLNQELYSFYRSILRHQLFGNVVGESQKHIQAFELLLYNIQFLFESH